MTGAFSRRAGQRSAHDAQPDEVCEHVEAAFDVAARHVLGRGVRERRIAGAEVERGDAARREAGDVGPAQLRTHREVERADELGDERIVEVRRRGAATR